MQYVFVLNALLTFLSDAASLDAEAAAAQQDYVAAFQDLQRGLKQIEAKKAQEAEEKKKKPKEPKPAAAKKKTVDTDSE